VTASKILYVFLVSTIRGMHQAHRNLELNHIRWSGKKVTNFLDL